MDNWKEAAENFFSHRGSLIGKNATLEELCYVSGRDPRLWSDLQQLEDLINSIVTQAQIGEDDNVLEVGCAAGFLARLIAPKTGKYVGVDIADGAVEAARSMGIQNALFTTTNPETLPFDDNIFDAAVSYDVVTNFPDFSEVELLIRNMMRVVRPGGKVLIGSIPNQAVKAGFEGRCVEFAKELTARFGPPTIPSVSQKVPFFKRLLGKKDPVLKADQGLIQCYYFKISDFENLAKQEGWELVICDIHSLSPYLGYRFNAVYTVPS